MGTGHDDCLRLREESSRNAENVLAPIKVQCCISEREGAKNKKFNSLSQTLEADHM